MFRIRSTKIKNVGVIIEVIFFPFIILVIKITLVIKKLLPTLPMYFAFQTTSILIAKTYIAGKKEIKIFFLYNTHLSCLNKF